MESFRPGVILVVRRRRRRKSSALGLNLAGRVNGESAGDVGIRKDS